MPFNIENAKGLFFDRPTVKKSLDQGIRRALSRFGAFVRRRDQTSIRKRKGISRPGKPPHSHEGSLRRLIFFAFDPAKQSVVIGPTLFKPGDVPELIEKGGTGTRTTRSGSKQFHYRARPHTKPAFDAELPKVPQFFKHALARRSA